MFYYNDYKYYGLVNGGVLEFASTFMHYWPSDSIFYASEVSDALRGREVSREEFMRHFNEMIAHMRASLPTPSVMDIIYEQHY